jgi:hypothetical protein
MWLGERQASVVQTHESLVYKLKYRTLFSIYGPRDTFLDIICIDNLSVRCTGAVLTATAL